MSTRQLPFWPPFRLLVSGQFSHSNIKCQYLKVRQLWACWPLASIGSLSGRNGILDCELSQLSANDARLTNTLEFAPNLGFPRYSSSTKLSEAQNIVNPIMKSFPF